MADQHHKKRKRQSDAHETPRKKPSSAEGGTIRVSFVEEDASHPALVSAPGVNPPRVSFKAYTRVRKETKDVNAAIGPKAHDLLLHSSQHPRLDYTATPTTTDQILSHYVAVYDPATQRLKVAPAHHLSLQTTLRSEVQDVEQDKGTYAQQREGLGREFGTKKARKVILSRTENAITQDTKGKGKASDVQNAVLDSVARGIVSQDTQEAADTLLAAKPIPKPNIAAESVEDVYSFNTLVPPDDARLVDIQEWQDIARAGGGIEFKHRFPAFRVNEIGKSDDFRKLKALRYLTFLLEFHDVCSNTRSGKKVPKKEGISKKLSGWPPQLIDSVRRRFTNDTGSELGKWQLDNLYTHICALSLYVDGWATDTTNLKDDLKLELKQLTLYFLELGCKVSALTETERTQKNLTKSQAAVMRMAKLKLPLEFPKPRNIRRR